MNYGGKAYIGCIVIYVCTYICIINDSKTTKGVFIRFSVIDGMIHEEGFIV